MFFHNPQNNHKVSGLKKTTEMTAAALHYSTNTVCVPTSRFRNLLPGKTSYNHFMSDKIQDANTHEISDYDYDILTLNLLFLYYLKVSLLNLLVCL